MRKGMRRFGANQDGASLLEFSLVAFMFIITMLGVVEMGRMILVYTSLCRRGACGSAICHCAWHRQ